MNCEGKSRSCDLRNCRRIDAAELRIDAAELRIDAAGQRLEKRVDADTLSVFDHLPIPDSRFPVSWLPERDESTSLHHSPVQL